MPIFVNGESDVGLIGVVFNRRNNAEDVSGLDGPRGSCARNCIAFALFVYNFGPGLYILRLILARYILPYGVFGVNYCQYAFIFLFRFFNYFR